MSTYENLSAGNLLSLLKKNAKKSQPLEPELIAALYRKEPMRWLSLLLIEGVLPEPRASFSPEAFKSIFDDLSNIIRTRSLPAKSVTEALGVIHSIMHLHLSYNEVRSHLASLPIWENPATLFYRLGAYMESQAGIAIKRILEVAISNDTFDPISPLRSDLSSPIEGGINQDVPQVVEEMQECVELIIRYVLHTHVPRVGFGELTEIESPYEDGVFQRLLDLSNTWRSLDELWARIKFLGWKLTRRENRIIFTPPDMDDFVRVHVGHYRTNIVRQQVVATEFAARSPTDTDTIDRIETLAAPLAMPPLGDVWNGEVDLECLRECCKSTMFVRAANYWISVRHYEALLSRIKIGNQTGWREWLLGYNVLQVLGIVLGQLASRSVSDLDGHGCLRGVFIVTRSKLTEILAYAAGLDSVSAREITESLTLDASRKNREIWDQPLLPLGGDRVLLVPTLVGAAEPTRVIENFVSELGTSFGLRGTPFEANIESWLRDRVSSNTQQGVAFDASDGRPVEYDLITWWHSRLVLIETKCLKSIHSSSDQYRARQEVEEAIDQLVRRRRLAISDWSRLRSSAVGLSLPLKPPAVEDVICIALTNLFQFTGLFRDGVTVTDDFCFRRYFGDPEIAELSIGSGDVFERRSGVRTRQGPPGPISLLGYLRSPPQARMVRKHLKLGWLPIRGFKDRTEPAFVLSTEFHAASTRDLVSSDASKPSHPPNTHQRSSEETLRRKQKAERSRKRSERAKRRH